MSEFQRKRAATSCLYQDDTIWSNVGNTLATSSIIEPISGRFSTKRSRIQRDLSDERVCFYIFRNLNYFITNLFSSLHIVSFFHYLNHMILYRK